MRRVGVERVPIIRWVTILNEVTNEDDVHSRHSSRAELCLSRLVVVNDIMIRIQISYRHFSTGPTVQAISSPITLIVILPPVTHLRLVLPLPPIQPTAGVVPHVPIARLLSLLTGRGAPLSRSAVKDHLLLRQGFVEHVFLDKGTGVVVGREVFLEGREGEGDGRGDGSEGDFVRFSDVYRRRRRGGNISPVSTSPVVELR